ncbi:Rhomboid protease GlpG [Ralstonia syzygii subsp. syzygii]|nr:Rhomboid protease GlpG [Ralstonia syzygii subsp. syzygii]
MINSLIVANVIVFVAELFAGDTLLRSFALWPPGAAGIGADGGFSPWQLVTYAFLHASVPHLVFNMFGMFMFGRDVERALGRARTGALYLASVLSAAFTQMAVVGFFTFPAGPIVGASGGVFGLLLAYAVLFPRRMILLLIPPIPMPAWLFATVYALVELTLGVSGSHSGVAHFAHLGGMAGSGVLLWRCFRGRDDAR